MQGMSAAGVRIGPHLHERFLLATPKQMAPRRKNAHSDSNATPIKTSKNVIPAARKQRSPMSMIAPYTRNRLWHPDLITVK